MRHVHGNDMGSWQGIGLSWQGIGLSWQGIGLSWQKITAVFCQGKKFFSNNRWKVPSQREVIMPQHRELPELPDESLRGQLMLANLIGDSNESSITE